MKGRSALAGTPTKRRKAVPTPALVQSRTAKNSLRPAGEPICGRNTVRPRHRCTQELRKAAPFPLARRIARKMRLPHQLWCSQELQKTVSDPRVRQLAGEKRGSHWLWCATTGPKRFPYPFWRTYDREKPASLWCSRGSADGNRSKTASHASNWTRMQAMPPPGAVQRTRTDLNHVVALGSRDDIRMAVTDEQTSIGSLRVEGWLLPPPLPGACKKRMWPNGNLDTPLAEMHFRGIQSRPTRLLCPTLRHKRRRSSRDHTHICAPILERP